jgi:integrative and conjugative element protein (TIGR02256 family)
VENIIIKIDNITIIITDSVFNNLKKESVGNIETGGTLYGFKLQRRNEYVISGLTTFQDNDIRTGYTFERKDLKHFDIINKEWEKDSSIMFLGDWHYHPSNNVNASWTDLTTFENLKKNSITSSKIICNIITCKNYFVLYVNDKKSNSNYSKEQIYFSK